MSRNSQHGNSSLSKGRIILKRAVVTVTLIALIFSSFVVFSIDNDFFLYSFAADTKGSGEKLMDFPGPDITSNKKDAAIIKYLFIKNLGSREEYRIEDEYDLFVSGRKYKGKGECWGYAEQCRKLFGTGGKKKVIRMKPTKKKVKNLLKKLRPGTHIRYGRSLKGDGYHSVCFLGLVGNKAYFTETNWSNNPINFYTTEMDWYSGEFSYWLWYIEPKGRTYSDNMDPVAANIAQNETIELAWLPVKDAKNYEIYRSYKKSGGFKKIKTVKHSYYVDRNAKAGRVYYKIKALGKKKKTSKVFSVIKRLPNPDVKIEYDEQGIPIATWDKVKDAKMYGIYKMGKGLKWKLFKSTKNNSYKFTSADQYGEDYLVVPMIKKGSKANAGGSFVYAARKLLAPDLKYLSFDANGFRFSAAINQDLSWVKGKKISIVLEHSRSEKRKYYEVSEMVLRNSNPDGKLFDYQNEFVITDESDYGSGKNYYRAYLRVYEKDGNEDYETVGFYTEPIVVNID